MSHILAMILISFAIAIVLFVVFSFIGKSKFAWLKKILIAILITVIVFLAGISISFISLTGTITQKRVVSVQTKTYNKSNTIKKDSIYSSKEENFYIKVEKNGRDYWIMLDEREEGFNDIKLGEPYKFEIGEIIINFDE